MAYPTVSAPYGLKPINLVGGQVFAGSTRYIPIASGYATSLFYGDLLQLGTTTNLGAVIQSAITFSTVSSTTNQTIGVFLGCTYTNPATSQKLFAQYWPGGTIATDAEAIVCDDPDTIFKAVVVANNGTASSTSLINLGAPWVGSNVFLVRNAGNTTSGNSNFAVCAGTSDVRTATTAPFRIVDIVYDTAVTVSQTATTATSTAMTLSAANTAITAGMSVTGSGVPTGTYVVSVSGTAVVLSQATTSTISTATAFGFLGSPEVLVKINFGYHAYYNAVGI
jgi:hypothetical protein